MLNDRLRLVRIGRVERPAAHEDARELVELEMRHRLGFEPHPDELVGREPAVPEEQRVLLVGGHIFGPGGEEDERLHDAYVTRPSSTGETSCGCVGTTRTVYPKLPVTVSGSTPVNVVTPSTSPPAGDRR